MKNEKNDKSVSKELNLTDIELITSVETKAGHWETPRGEKDENEWWTITLDF